jgi:hypothetical protein
VVGVDDMHAMPSANPLWSAGVWAPAVSGEEVVLEMADMGVILLIGVVLMGALVCNGTDTEPELVVTLDGRSTAGRAAPPLSSGFGAPTEFCRTDETLDAGASDDRLGAGGCDGAPNWVAIALLRVVAWNEAAPAVVVVWVRGTGGMD